MRSMEALRADNLKAVLINKGLTKKDLERVFRASRDANEHQIMLMDMLLTLKKRPDQAEIERNIKGIIYKYKMLDDEGYKE